MLDEMEVNRYEYSRVHCLIISCFPSMLWEASTDDLSSSLFSDDLSVCYHRIATFDHAMLAWKSIQKSPNRPQLPNYNQSYPVKFEWEVNLIEEWVANQYCKLFFLHFGRAASIPYLCRL
jgi:hypothetical protein